MIKLAGTALHIAVDTIVADWLCNILSMQRVLFVSEVVLQADFSPCNLNVLLVTLYDGFDFVFFGKVFDILDRRGRADVWLSIRTACRHLVFFDRCSNIEVYLVVR